MMYVHAHTAFVAYVLSAFILTLNVLFLWVYSGLVRAKTKQSINKEDSELYGTSLSHEHPLEVARVLRAYQNAQTIIYPFFIFGLLYVLVGGWYILGLILFALIIISRIAHSYFYLKGIQPWRTYSFSVSLLALLVLMITVIIKVF